MPDRALPAVLIPGLQADASAWSRQMGAFPRAVFVPGGYHRAGSIDAMGDAIVPDLPERFHLVGWSMGGYIALSLLERLMADRVASLTLIATTARDEVSAPRPGRADTVPQARALGLRAHQREVLRGCFADPAFADTPFADAMVEASERLGLAALQAQVEAVVARPDRRALLPAIRIPTLVVVGDADAVIPPPLSREIAAAIPGAQLIVVPRAGHCAPVERPDVLNPDLEMWFAAHDG